MTDATLPPAPPPFGANPVHPVRPATGRLRLAEVVAALSYALDLTGGQSEGHALQSCVVGMAVGAGFSVAEIVTNSAIKATLDLHSEYRDGAIFMLVMVVVGPFAHAVYTGLAAWGLGQFLCRTDQPLGWRLPRNAGWFLLAAALHGAFNAARMLPGVAGLVGRRLEDAEAERGQLDAVVEGQGGGHAGS